MNNPLDHALRQVRRRPHDATSALVCAPARDAATTSLPMHPDWTAPRTGGVRWIVEQDGTLHAIAA